ncbi:hypothetical protein [Escherichia coli]|nr:hypothetical protein [Escherichia coli]WJW40029.1 hypothetical protein QVM94_23675 [Escherichia coli]
MNARLSLRGVLMRASSFQICHLSVTDDVVVPATDGITFLLIFSFFFLLL